MGHGGLLVNVQIVAGGDNDGSVIEREANLPKLSAWNDVTVQVGGKPQGKCLLFDTSKRLLERRSEPSHRN